MSDIAIKPAESEGRKFIRRFLKRKTVAFGVLILVVFVLLAIFWVTRAIPRHRMDWLAGAVWALPWLGGLCLISYLGDYPDRSAHAGNRALISFGWGFVVVLGLTALVYVLAVLARLPRERVEAHIEQTSAEAAEEEGMLGETAS